MKYFKYPFQKRIIRKMISEMIKKYSKNQKRNYYILKVMTYIAIMFFFLLMAPIIYFAVNMYDYPNNNIIATILSVLLCVIFIPASAIISFIIFTPIFKFFPYNSLPEITSQMINKVTKPLKEFYRVPNEYIITKCYHSTDNKLINKDVLLFFNNESIRVVNNFYSSTKDFGCYEFKLDEIEFYNQKINNKITTIIKNKKITLHLGYRAKTFIMKNVSDKIESR